LKAKSIRYLETEAGSHSSGQGLEATLLTQLPTFSRLEDKEIKGHEILVTLLNNNI
jgi:hypothetical protein